MSEGGGLLFCGASTHRWPCFALFFVSKNLRGYLVLRMDPLFWAISGSIGSGLVLRFFFLSKPQRWPCFALFFSSKIQEVTLFCTSLQCFLHEAAVLCRDGLFLHCFCCAFCAFCAFLCFLLFLLFLFLFFSFLFFVLLCFCAFALLRFCAFADFRGGLMFCAVFFCPKP